MMRWHPPGIARIASAHGMKAEAHVLDASRQRTLHREGQEGRGTFRLSRGIEGRDAAHGGPDAGDAATIRWIADRTAIVVAVGDRPDARADRRCGAAGGAASRAPLGPWIIGAPAQRVVGVPAQ